MDKDIFVSYSRRNQAICRNLVAALARTEQDTWVDWEGIPLSADWWAEIERGIEQAETILVLLSNDWLNSPVCHLELDYALSLNKRVVPVIYGDIDNHDAFMTLATKTLDAAVLDMLAGRDINTVARDNWRALSKINWAFYREDDFTEGASKLLAALQTDLAHARTHTRLLGRALEWERGEHDASLLLRGIDLDQAVGWLAYNADTEPLPTEAHRTYITASVAQRDAEIAAERDQQARELALQARALNRARLLIASLGLFLVVAALLSVFALQQREEAIVQAVRADENAAISAANERLAQENEAKAIAERDRADREAQIAKAREIAAQAIGLINNRAAQAMLLGVAAYQTAPVFEAESGLLTLMSASDGILATSYQRNQQGIAQAIYNPSQSLMAVAYFNGEDRVSIMDTMTDSIFYTLEGGDELPNSSIHFWDDDSLLLSDAIGLHLLSIDLGTGAVEQSTLFNYDTTHSIAYSAIFNTVGLRVATATYDPEATQHFMIVYDIETGLELYRQKIDFQVLSMEFNSDGTQILANRYRDTPVLFNLTDGRVSPLITNDDLVEGIQQAYFYDDYSYVTLASVPGNGRLFISVYDPTLDLFYAPITVRPSISRLALTPAKDYVVALEAGGNFTVYRITDGQTLISSNYHENEIFSVTFTQDGNVMSTGDSSGVFVMWFLHGKSPLQLPIEEYTNPALAMSLAGERLAVSIEMDSIRQYDVKTWQEVGPHISVSEDSLYLTVLALSENHERLIAFDGTSGQILVWDAQTGDRLTDSLTGDETSTSMAVSPDGRLVIAYNPEIGLSVWDVEKQVRVGDVIRATSDLGFDITNEIINMVFTPDGTQLAVISFTGHLWLYDVSMEGLTLQKQVVVSRALQIGLQFSPDGKLLALASDSNAILLYDINAEQLSIPPLSGATTHIYNIAFRPDGRVIAVMDGYSQLWLWDTARGLPIGLPEQAHYIGYDAAYTADGQHLITVGSNPVISEWDFRPEQIILSLCETVGRELTPQEWALYVSATEPHRSICTR